MKTALGTKLLWNHWMLIRIDNRQRLVDINNKETCSLKKRSYPTPQIIYFQDTLAHAGVISFISGRKLTTIYFRSKAFTIASRISRRFKSSGIYKLIKRHCSLLKEGLAALLFEDLVRDLHFKFFFNNKCWRMFLGCQRKRYSVWLELISQMNKTELR